MAYLGKHYSHKIRAATEVALHRATNSAEHGRDAIRDAQRAAFYWRTYVSYLSAAYQTPIWLNRLGDVDWKLFYFDALHDVRSLGGDLDLPSMETTPGGTILEAEDGRTDAERSGRQGGFTGTGYLAVLRVPVRGPVRRVDVRRSRRRPIRPRGALPRRLHGDEGRPGPDRRRGGRDDRAVGHRWAGQLVLGSHLGGPRQRPPRDPPPSERRVRRGPPQRDRARPMRQRRLEVLAGVVLVLAAGARPAPRSRTRPRAGSRSRTPSGSRSSRRRPGRRWSTTWTGGGRRITRGGERRAFSRSSRAREAASASATANGRLCTCG